MDNQLIRTDFCRLDIGRIYVKESLWIYVFIVFLNTESHIIWNNNELWLCFKQKKIYDDVIKWKHFPCYWPLVWGIHRSPVNFPHKGQWCGTLMFSLICTWINGWVNNHEAGDFRCHHTHNDTTVMFYARIAYLCRHWSATTCNHWPFCLEGAMLLVQLSVC